MSSLEELYRKGALGADTNNAVFMEGAANLIGNDQDSSRMRLLLRALEEKERVVELLNAYLGTHEEAVRVVIGLDQAPADLRNFVLIGAPARVGTEVVGSLAVIGPTRMDYQHTITAVSYIARMFDKILNETEKQ
jgi:heat-inducible transcriptional repressor